MVPGESAVVVGRVPPANSQDDPEDCRCNFHRAELSIRGQDGSAGLMTSLVC